MSCPLGQGSLEHLSQRQSPSTKTYRIFTVVLYSEHLLNIRTYLAEVLDTISDLAKAQNCSRSAVCMWIVSYIINIQLISLVCVLLSCLHIDYLCDNFDLTYSYIAYNFIISPGDN